VDSGWFIPQTILCMACPGLAGFTQPSIELGYAIKFMRVFNFDRAAILEYGGLWPRCVIIFIVLVKYEEHRRRQLSVPVDSVSLWNTLKHLAL
jgi:stage V sporulation protein AF